MATLGGKVFILNPFSSATPFNSRISKVSPLGDAITTQPSHPRTVLVKAHQRPTWLSGLESPPYLDGTLAGDFGFDTLGLRGDSESLKWYVQAEIVHSRFAMLGVAGILFTDIREGMLKESLSLQLLRVTGLKELPVWHEASAAKYELANTQTLYAETRRYMDFVSPGSQAQEGSFFGMEAALEGLEPGYPGSPLLNPLGLTKDIKNAREWKLKEIKNRRLALIAMLGFFVQASVTHVGPINNLLEHLSDPWHRTIVQTSSIPPLELL